MSKQFVVITKSVADLEENPLNLPAHYPLECVEVASPEEAATLFPGKPTMSVEAYNGYKEALQPLWDAAATDAAKEQPWWAFWRS